MKRFLSLVFAAMMVMSLMAVPAFAQADALTVTQNNELLYTETFPHSPALTITNDSPHAVNVTVEVFDEDARVNVQSLNFTLNAGDAPFNVDGFAYKNLPNDGQVNTYRYVVSTAGGFKKVLYFAQRMQIDKQYNTVTYVQWENTRFPKNTASSFGPQFRIVDPKLTDKWYMFTPINLGLQGRQTFELIASNMYVVGEVYVDVQGDLVTVNYKLFHGDERYTKVERVSDYLNFFPAFSTVTTVNPEELPSQFQFGVPFSITEKLAGDTNVLMFVRNMLSYNRFPAPTAEYTRFYPNLDHRKVLREQMLEMMDPMEGLDLDNKHNYGS